MQWQLRANLEQDIVYETTTDGEYNGWNQSNSPRRAIGSALEAAVFTLFSDQDFVARLTDDETGFTEGTSSSQPAEVQQQSSITDWLMKRAQATQAIVEINSLKVYSIQHHASEGEWPGNLSAIGFNESMFYDSDTIASVSLNSDGSIVAELKESFGDDKIITLRPEVNESRSRWHCSSNLDPAYLPRNCEQQ